MVFILSGKILYSELKALKSYFKKKKKKKRWLKNAGDIVLEIAFGLRVLNG